MVVPLSAERCRVIIDFAKASYISDSLYHDPGLTKGIDNVLLLLLRLVLQVSEEGSCLHDNIGLNAGDRLRALLRAHRKLPRSVRRWLSAHEMLFVHLAESMAEALKHDELPQVPPLPLHGFPKYVQVEGPSENQPVFLQLATDGGDDVRCPSAMDRWWAPGRRWDSSSYHYRTGGTDSTAGDRLGPPSISMEWRTTSS